MKKRTKIGVGIGIGVVTASAVGTGVSLGLLLQHHDNHDNLTLDQNLDRIYNSIYHITGQDDSTYESFDHFHRSIMSKIETDDASLEDSVIEKLQDRMATVYDQIEQNLDITKEADKMIINLIEKYKQDTDEVINQIKSGYVGIHDFEYYKKLIEGKADLSRVIANKEELEAKILENKKQATEAKEEAAQAKSAITVVESELTKVETSISDVETNFVAKLSDLETDMNTQINDLKNTYSVDKAIITTNINNLKSVFTTQINGLKTALTETKTEIASNTCSIKELETKTMVMNAKFVNVFKSLNILFQNFTSLQNELKAHKAATDASITNLNTKFNTLETMINTLQTKLSSYDEKFNDLENRIYDLEAEIGTINEKTDNLDMKLTHISQVVHVNKLELDTLSQSLQTIEGKWASLNTAIEANSSKINQLVIKIFNMEQSVARVFARLDDITSQLNANTAKIYNLEERLSKIEQAASNSGSTVLYQADSVSSALPSNIWLELPSLKDYSQLMITFQRAKYGDEFISEIVPIHSSLYHDHSETFMFTVFKDRDHAMPIYLQIRETPANTYEIRVVNELSDSTHANRYSNKFISITGIK